MKVWYNIGMNNMYKSLLTGSLLFFAILTFTSIKPLPVNAQTCSPDATKQCISNIVYWYDSCGALEAVAQNCNTTGQICQNAMCVNKAGGTTTTTTTPGVIKDEVKSCYNGNIYWFNSDGSVGDLYQTCNDNNSCTADNCAGQKCVNELKCDGSTCAVGSADYATYCGGTTTSTGNQNPTQNQNPGTTNTTTGTVTTTTQATGQGLFISMFGKKDSTLPAWQKDITVANKNKIDFLIVVKNVSTTPIDNVSVITDLTSNISYTGNLEIGGLASAGNLATGISLGTFSPKASQVISFTGTLNSQTPQGGTVQANTTVSSGGTQYDSDYLIMNIAPANSTTASTTTSTSGNSWITNFFKTWWIWIIIIIVLVVIFVIIFRRLSASV